MNLMLPFLIIISIELIVPSNKKISGIKIGLALLMAILFFQGALLFVLVIIFYALISKKFPFKSLMLPLFIAASGSILIYGLAILYKGLYNWQEILLWLTSSLHSFAPGAPQQYDLVLGFINSIIAIPNGFLGFKVLTLSLLIGQILVFLIYLWKSINFDKANSLSNFKKQTSPIINENSNENFSLVKKHAFQLCFLWFIIFFIAAWRWEALHFKFWIPVIPPFLIMIFVIPKVSKISIIRIFTFALFLFIINLVCHAIPAANIENDNDYKYAEKIYEITGADGFVISPFDFFTGNSYLLYSNNFINYLERRTWESYLLSHPLETLNELERKARKTTVLYPYKHTKEDLQFFLNKIPPSVNKKAVLNILNDLYLEPEPILQLDMQDRGIYIQRTKLAAFKVDFYQVRSKRK